MTAARNSRICFRSISSFFVDAALNARQHRYRLLFDMAWDGKGFIIDLTRVPDDILRLMIAWREERIDEEKGLLPSK
jgi:hypothetical protein